MSALGAAGYTGNMDTSSVRSSQDQVDDLILGVLPGQGQWSEDAYLWLTDHTNRLIEYTDGYLEVLPMPTDRHQSLLLFLYEKLRAHLRGRGKVLVAPMRLRVGSRKFREPDLLLLLDAADPRRGNRFWSGADLVVEILSPDKPERDLVEKRVDYAEAGILEYWLVDPADESLTVLELRGGAYRTWCTWRRGGVAKSPLVDGFALAMDDLFDVE